jgi:hypothetical protein
MVLVEEKFVSGVSEGPESEQPTWQALPSPPDRTNRRRPLVIGLVVGAIAVFAALAAIGFLVAPTESEIVLEEDFSSDEPEFTTDSDPHVDQTVSGGAYHILIKDASSPQLTRHIFDHSYDAFRFESTVTLRGPRDVVFSVGCWSGNSAYVLALAGDGEMGLIETVSESTGERRPLTRGTTTEALRPVGEPNRLRIDCVGGGSEPTVVSGWINGAPVLSVSVSDGYDSFNAVGFFIGSGTDGAEFVVDDVVAVAERPRPAKSPVPPIES